MEHSGKCAGRGRQGTRHCVYGPNTCACCAVPTQCGACIQDIVNTRVSGLMSSISGREALLIANSQLVRLPPDPTDHTVPKRTWERAMRDPRNDLMVLEDADLWVHSLTQDPS